METTLRRKLRNTKPLIKKLLEPSAVMRIPSNFNAEECTRHLPAHVNKEVAKDLFFFVLDEIVSENQPYGYNLTKQFCDPVPIHKTLLKKIFGNDYTHGVSALIAHNVIKLSKKYRVGVSSNTYYLTEKYRYKATIFRNLSQRTISRMKKTKDDSDKEDRLLERAHILYWFTTGKLSIDEAGALACINNIDKSYFAKLQNGAKTKQLDIFEHSTELREKQIKGLLSNFNTHNYYAKIDKNNRLYTVISSLPEPLRCFIKYDGRNLVAVDISNSQPFHFCYLFQKDFWAAQAKTCSLKSIYPGLYKNYEDSGLLNRIRKFVNHNTKEPDVLEFIKQTKEGTFYDALAERYGRKYKSLNSREKAKVEFIQYLNFNLEKKASNKYGAYRHIAESLPNIFGLMELVKESGYTDMAAILQRLEAKMFLLLVGKTFAIRYPEAPLYPVHDTLITYQNKEEELKEIIYEVYEKHLNSRPNVKATPLVPETAFNNIEKYVTKKYKKLFSDG